ncbi:hypothetical protein ACM7HV_29030 [Pseudomonas paraeruginosa]|uniref:Uncharacterized protein n=1 Tax=Pseudomonas aeruginosa TaxID=287 RepID=A0ABD7JUL2_PSEAI|nr:MULTISPECIES: hypothetical protein [Pseudomonas aeruginosa group]RTR90942.1 hypothetical protein DY932_30290 [Pseudomonas paraeruginosa]RTS40109.1 hypothetical protein DY940_30500 [Pseudomonas aeruginosa]
MAALDDGGSLLGDPSIFREEYLQKTWPFRSAETRVFRGFQTDNEKLAESLPKASEEPRRVARGTPPPRSSRQEPARETEAGPYGLF